MGLSEMLSEIYTRLLQDELWRIVGSVKVLRNHKVVIFINAINTDSPERGACVV